MAYISFQPKDYFSALKYTGTGSSNAVTGVGFSPDAVWIKTTSNGQKPCLFDTVRGVQKVIFPSETTAEITDAALLTAFGVDGFTVTTDADVNGNGYAFSSWNWKMGTTSVPSGGSITPSAVSINTTSKQGIYKWTGNGSAGATIAHGLGQAPKFIMIKNIGGVHDWACYHANADDDLTQAGDYFFRLNTAAARDDNSGYFNDTITTDTLITLGADNPVNQSGNEMIMYAFCDVPGYFNRGVYAGNGNADGAFVYTGFEPEMIIAKNRNSGGPAAYGWSMISNTFGMGGATTANPAYNELTQNVFADQLAAAATGNAVDFLSNGFKWRSTGTGGNQAAPFIYVAFAKNPIVSSNSKVGTAR